MCTVVVFVGPDRVMLAANRDERIERAWDPPAAWWPDRPEVIGGRDRLGGGTWMAINRHGVVATVLNRPGTLGPAVGKRSRGELPLLALEHPTAAAAADALTSLDAGLWRGFNMVLVDRSGGWFVSGSGHGRPRGATLPARGSPVGVSPMGVSPVGVSPMGVSPMGVSMVTAYDPNDLDSPRIARHLPRFQAVEASWDAWRGILSDRRGGPAEQINVVPRGGFGTVSASVVTLSTGGERSWLFAAGAPDQAEFLPVNLG